MMRWRKYNRIIRKKEGVRMLTAKEQPPFAMVKVETKQTEGPESPKRNSKARELLRRLGNRYKDFDLLDYSRRPQ